MLKFVFAIPILLFGLCVVCVACCLCFSCSFFTYEWCCVLIVFFLRCLWCDVPVMLCLFMLCARVLLDMLLFVGFCFVLC